MSAKVLLHVYMSSPLKKTAEKLGFKLPDTAEFPWTVLVASPFGQFGADSVYGYAFHLHPTKEALESVVPVLKDVLQKATTRQLRLTVEYSTNDRKLAAIVEPWRQRLFDMGFEVL